VCTHRYAHTRTHTHTHTHTASQGCTSEPYSKSILQRRLWACSNRKVEPTSPIWSLALSVSCLLLSVSCSGEPVTTLLLSPGLLFPNSPVPLLPMSPASPWLKSQHFQGMSSPAPGLPLYAVLSLSTGPSVHSRGISGHFWQDSRLPSMCKVEDANETVTPGFLACSLTTSVNVKPAPAMCRPCVLGCLIAALHGEALLCFGFRQLCGKQR
jgi:hypothetical protein